MGSAGSGRAGRIALVLFGLNVLVVLAGLGIEYVAANRHPDLPEFNATKIRAWTQPEAYKPGESAKTTQAAQPPVDPIGRLCLEISELSQPRFSELRALATAAGIAQAQCTYSFEKKLAWWVFWPPEYEAGQRDKALQAMRAAGQKDILPITQGAMAQSFSLAVFSAESQARQQRDLLRSKGLDKVEYGPRPSAGIGRLVCTSDNGAQLEQLRVGLPGWVKQLDPAQCPAGPTPQER